MKNYFLIWFYDLTGICFTDISSGTSRDSNQQNRKGEKTTDIELPEMADIKEIINTFYTYSEWRM